MVFSRLAHIEIPTGLVQRHENCGLLQLIELTASFATSRLPLDASLAVAAARYGTTDLLSLDERHFRAIAPLWGEAFRLLPADRHNNGTSMR